MGSTRDCNTEAEQISDGFVSPHLLRQQNSKIGILTSYFQHDGESKSVQLCTPSHAVLYFNSFN